jgi:hypothetical protein
MGNASHPEGLIPVELAEYAKARGIDNEPAFAWWVQSTIRRRNAILSAVKARCQKKTHKFGIELPTSIIHARELDRVMKTTSGWGHYKRKCSTLGLHLRFLRMEPVHPRDGTRPLVTLYGTVRWILQE